MNMFTTVLSLLQIPHTSLAHIVTLIGYPGIFAAIFAETGVFFGFFLPGSSLLFTAGLLASKGVFNIWVLFTVASVAAILGDNAGYWFGSTVGHQLYNRADSRFFKKKYLLEAHAFYQKYGLQTIVLARFIPVIRTFVPIVAGIAEMDYKRFFLYNVFGGFLWAGGMCVAGYYLGKHVPWVSTYLTPIILVIIFISILPVLVQFYKQSRTKSHS
ncbi:MAG: putative rane-associated protein [Candidatus Kaiserbacteria bacterium]|nr:putative rane-associated protein [Candidatus Kaiserbacteria bacterium]